MVILVMLIRYEYSLSPACNMFPELLPVLEISSPISIDVLQAIAMRSGLGRLVHKHSLFATQEKIKLITRASLLVTSALLVVTRS